jgi:hypothetical protein
LYLFDTVNSHGLVNYYPIIDAVKRDIVGGKDPFECTKVKFDVDEFGAADSALNFNGGYCKLPTNDYLNHPNGLTFTFRSILFDITGDFYFISFDTNSRDDAFFRILADGDKYIEIEARTPASYDNYYDFDTEFEFVENVWQHHVLVNKDIGLYYYRDGKLIYVYYDSTDPHNFSTSFEFDYNFLGARELPNDILLGKIDEIRFYNYAFESAQARTDFNVKSFLKKIIY